MFLLMFEAGTNERYQILGYPIAEAWVLRTIWIVSTYSLYGISTMQHHPHHR